MPQSQLKCFSECKSNVQNIVTGNAYAKLHKEGSTWFCLTSEHKYAHNRCIWAPLVFIVSCCEHNCLSCREVAFSVSKYKCAIQVTFMHFLVIDPSLCVLCKWIVLWNRIFHYILHIYAFIQRSLVYIWSVHAFPGIGFFMQLTA